jgi:uncharacterized protein DUF4185
LPDDPLARPQPSKRCPELDTRNSLGRGVMARSTDDGRTFAHVVAMPEGFVYSTAIDTRMEIGLPKEQRLGIFILGVPRYRASVPYLAYAPEASFDNPATWKFFTGRGADGRPEWVTRREWMRGASSPVTPRPGAWRPPGQPEIFVSMSSAESCIGEFSITWNRPLGMWLMLYNCPAGIILARVAPAPWGPWSAPSRILSIDDDVACRLVMTPQGCGSRRDYWGHGNGRFIGGEFYAPFVLNRYTTAEASSGRDRRSTIYWLVSTWNPYAVTVMRTLLKRD